jgi:hypothetical protein
MGSWLPCGLVDICMGDVHPKHSKVHFSPCGAKNLQPRSGGAIEIFALAASVISESALQQRRACDHQYKNEREKRTTTVMSAAPRIFSGFHTRGADAREERDFFYCLPHTSVLSLNDAVNSRPIHKFGETRRSLMSFGPRMQTLSHLKWLRLFPSTISTRLIPGPIMLIKQSRLTIGMGL